MTTQNQTNQIGPLVNGGLFIGSGSGPAVEGNITAGTGITVTNGSNTITIAATGAGLTWSTITGATLSAVISHGYVINDSSAQCVVTLPATFAVGDAIRLNGLSTGMGWVATANTGQTIQFGTQSSSSAGSWGTTVSTDSCLITGLVANTTWGLSDVVSSGLTKV